jgi:hypothetical protein
VGAIAGAGGRHAGPWRLVLVACCLLASATGSIASETDDVGAETVGIIDRAIHQLAAPSSDYRRILVDAIAALPAGADQRASGEIGAFLARAPQPGADFPCSLDFVKSRARKTLIPLRDTLRNEYVGLVEPEVCYTVPFALDRTLLPVAGGWLDIYGYDLNRVHPEMVLVNTGGYRDVSAALVTRSHYHLAFNLAGSLPWSSESVSLGLTWGHLIHYSIAVIQPDSRLCPSRIETIPAGRTISYAPPRIRRDARRAGVAATAVADTTFDFSTNKLEATVCVTAVDRRRHATFSGCTVEFLYTTDPDRVIEALPRDPATHVSYRHQPGELSATVRLGEISLVSIADEGCVSPLASKRGEPAPWIGRRARRSTRSCRR